MSIELLESENPDEMILKFTDEDLKKGIDIEDLAMQLSAFPGWATLYRIERDNEKGITYFHIKIYGDEDQ